MVGENKFPRKRWRLLIGIACLLVTIVGASVLFVSEFAQRQAKASPGNHLIATTPTVKLTPKVQSQLTPQPLFSDSFVDNSNGWYTSQEAGYTRTLSNGLLTLSGTNHTTLVESLPTSNTFNDFSITVTFTLLQADNHDSAGLYLRGDSNLDHDYRVDINGDNTYAISKESLDESHNLKTTPLVSPTHTPSLRPVGQQNTLTVMMKGSTLTMTLNGTQVKSVTDTDYTHGQIALFVDQGSTSTTVTATFSSIVIWPVPEESSDAP
ncbi:MAG: DUF1080 domain-containing protein [Chloroflexi bacterium]|nr:DUF1080 domain-containing protein [Chloroflexota bacterium]